MNELTKNLKKKIRRLEREREEITTTYKLKIKAINARIHWLNNQVNQT